MPEKFANIAFNLPLDSLFTYSITKEFAEEISPGSRVLVEFGRKNITGIVISFAKSTELKKVKPVLKVLDPIPVITPEMIEFCKWVSKYYICPIGEVIFAAVPKGILVESRILYKINPEADIGPLTELQKSIVDIISSAKSGVTIKQIGHRLKHSNIRNAVMALAAKDVLITEHITSNEKVRAKLEKFVVFDLKEDFSGFTSQMLEIFMKENKIRSTCQYKLLKYLVGKNISEISAKELLAKTGATAYSLNSFAKKEFVSFSYKQVNRAGEHEFSPDKKMFSILSFCSE
jgi:primosomal protein N' (replication factor Y) (superfamily II helicase)